MSAATKGAASRAPTGDLAEYTDDDLRDNAHLVLARCRELKAKGDELSAKSWGDRWLELTDELSRREFGPHMKTATGKPGKARKPAKGGKAPRIKWRYAPVPLAVLDDQELSVNAKAITAAIVRLLNLGPWNTDLHIDARYDDLARLASVSRSTAIRAVAELQAANYLEAIPIGGRAGCRLRFQATIEGA